MRCLAARELNKLAEDLDSASHLANVVSLWKGLFKNHIYGFYNISDYAEILINIFFFRTSFVNALIEKSFLAL